MIKNILTLTAILSLTTVCNGQLADNSDCENLLKSTLDTHEVAYERQLIDQDEFPLPFWLYEFSSISSHRKAVIDLMLNVYSEKLDSGKRSVLYRMTPESQTGQCIVVIQKISTDPSSYETNYQLFTLHPNSE